MEIGLDPNISVIKRLWCNFYQEAIHERQNGQGNIKILRNTVMILSFRTDSFGQTVQTQIRLLQKEQSDQGLHCLLYHLHL